MTAILLLSLLAALFFVALILVALQRDYWRDRALYAEALEHARNRDQQWHQNLNKLIGGQHANLMPTLFSGMCTCGYGTHVLCSDKGPSSVKACPVHGNIARQQQQRISKEDV